MLGGLNKPVGSGLAGTSVSEVLSVIFVFRRAVSSPVFCFPSLQQLRVLGHIVLDDLDIGLQLPQVLFAEQVVILPGFKISDIILL